MYKKVKAVVIVIKMFRKIILYNLIRKKNKELTSFYISLLNPNMKFHQFFKKIMNFNKILFKDNNKFMTL